MAKADERRSALSGSSRMTRTAFPVRFDGPAWEEDLARSTDAGRRAAVLARGRFEAEGIDRAELRPCDPEARDGTRLPGCVKAYLPPPAGRFGMVFRFLIVDDR
ncbi:MAG: hypothetical protein ACRET5_06125, partial [Steroidobacteraceae bacterium]